MKDIWIRQVREEDSEAISALNNAAFGTPDEAKIVAQLAEQDDSLYSLIAHNDRDILGHIQFFKIAVDGEDVAAGLGPMCVTPDRQRSGIGSGLVEFGMRLMEGSGRSVVFVLGHADYYPRFGFEAGLAQPFSAPWSGPAFMARRFGDAGPSSGTLTYPAAFGA